MEQWKAPEKIMPSVVKTLLELPGERRDEESDTNPTEGDRLRDYYTSAFPAKGFFFNVCMSLPRKAIDLSQEDICEK